MKPPYKIISKSIFSTWVPILAVFFLISGVWFQSQSQVKRTQFSIHAGINGGILSGGAGPSLSFQYTPGKVKLLQFQSNLIFDYHSGQTFLSGYTQQNTGFGLLAGLRVNLRPQNTWNPSLFLLPGLMIPGIVAFLEPLDWAFQIPFTTSIPLILD